VSLGNLHEWELRMRELATIELCARLGDHYEADWVSRGCSDEAQAVRELVKAIRAMAESRAPAPALEFMRATPEQVPFFEGAGYRVSGGHRYALDDVSVLMVRDVASRGAGVGGDPSVSPAIAEGPQEAAMHTSALAPGLDDGEER